VPSGASTGKHEAWELRDGDKRRYGGKGVLKAVNNVNQKIAPALVGKKAYKQEYIDELMIKMDGTPNKDGLGANAILAVSLACARAAAQSKHLPLYQYLRSLSGLSLSSYKLPTPMFNIFNGGKHADTNLDFQEFMIVPQGINKLSEKVRAGAEVFHALAKVLLKHDRDTDVGNEGGYAPDINSSIDAINYILEAIKLAGYNQRRREIFLGVDVGSSELYRPRKKSYVFQLDEHELNRQQMIELFKDWVKKYPFISLEDPLEQDDWSGWQEITRELGKKVMLIGDDLFVTNPERLKMGISKNAANAILVKLNQIGTLSETLHCIGLAKINNYRTIISHRSGETNDDFIADLAVAVNADYLKAGSLSRGERLAKWNRLMEIEREI
jgi:enolase